VIKPLTMPPNSITSIENVNFERVQGRKKSGIRGVVESYEKYIMNQVKLKSSALKLLLRCCCLKSKRQSKEENLMNAVVKKISLDVDIVSILKKIQEIDKLKKILLTKSQLNIFDYMPSPVITADVSASEVKPTLELSKSMSPNDIDQKTGNIKDSKLKEMMGLYDDYDKLKLSDKVIDNNLIKHMDNATGKLFQNFERRFDVSIIIGPDDDVDDSAVEKL